MSFSHISRQSELCHFLGVLFEHELDEISKHLILKRVRYGQRFFPLQTGRRKIFVVLSGCLKITEGDKFRFAAFKGDFFGNIFGGNESDCAHVISKDGLLMIIDKERFHAWLHRHPRLHKIYFEKIQEKISEMQAWQLHMLRSNTKSRLLFLLKKMAAKEGKRVNNVVSIVPLARVHLAAIIFSSPSTLGRALRILSEEGKITVKTNVMEVYVGLNCIEIRAVA